MAKRKQKAVRKNNIITKLKKAGLIGRGGACYPTWMKWSAVKENLDKLEPKSRIGYVICNVSEGEPEVKKDHYILKHWPERVIDGMKIAINYLGAEKGYLYINKPYYKEFAKNLTHLIDKSPIELFVKPHDAGYIGGEENALMNAIEGKRVEPRLRPPFPVEKGLWGYPTLINNVETLYNVSLVYADKYKKTRFYSINGDALWEGVYEYPEDMPMVEILRATKNYPKFPFFVQVGGGASGEVLNSNQLNRPAFGAGSITIYSMVKHAPLKVVRNWVNFFQQNSCGQCTPCREGTYRLKQELDKSAPDWNIVSVLLTTLKETSFCGLGCAVPVPITSFVQNVLSTMPENKINLPNATKQLICECFK